VPEPPALPAWVAEEAERDGLGVSSYQMEHS